MPKHFSTDKDPREQAIDRLIKAVRRGNDHFINLLIQRDRLATSGEDYQGHTEALAKLDKDISANEKQLASLGYKPKHKEKAHAAEGDM